MVYDEINGYVLMSVNPFINQMGKNVIMPFLMNLLALISLCYQIVGTFLFCYIVSDSEFCSCKLWILI